MKELKEGWEAQILKLKMGCFKTKPPHHTREVMAFALFNFLSEVGSFSVSTGLILD